MVELSESQVLILIDTEWFLHRHEKPMGPDDGCEVEDDFDFFVQVHDALQQHEGKHIMIVMHHPMFSNGSHGGYYTLKDHIFPLTNVHPSLYLPLPGIGSIYPLARGYGVSPEDLPHPRYQSLKKGLLQAIGQQDYVVMAAGHEHSLSLHPFEQGYHILSGAGTKANKSRKGKVQILSILEKDSAGSITIEMGRYGWSFGDQSKMVAPESCSSECLYMPVMRLTSSL